MLFAHWLAFFSIQCPPMSSGVSSSASSIGSKPAGTGSMTYIEKAKSQAPNQDPRSEALTTTSRKSSGDVIWIVTLLLHDLSHLFFSSSFGNDQSCQTSGRKNCGQVPHTKGVPRKSSGQRFATAASRTWQNTIANLTHIRCSVQPHLVSSKKHTPCVFSVKEKSGHELVIEPHVFHGIPCLSEGLGRMCSLDDLLHKNASQLYESFQICRHL